MNDEEQQTREMAAAHAERPYPEPMPNFEYLKAWHWFTGSSPEYTAAVLDQAIDLGAPHDATYYRLDEGRWATVRDIKNPVIRQAVISIAEDGLDDDKP
jgi:hypothetical protein